MNWVDALPRLRNTFPPKALGTLVAGLRPGQQLLYVRPLTEGAQNWQAPWTKLVRRRSAQWGAILQNDVNNGTLKADRLGAAQLPRCLLRRPTVPSCTARPPDRMTGPSATRVSDRTSS